MNFEIPKAIRVIVAAMSHLLHCNLLLILVIEETLNFSERLIKIKM